METDVSQGLQSRTDAEPQPSWACHCSEQSTAHGAAVGLECPHTAIPNTGSCLLTLGNLSLQNVGKCDFREKSPPLPLLSHLPHVKPLAFGLGCLSFALCLVCLRVVLTARALPQDAASPHQALKKDLRENAGFMILNLFFLKQCPEEEGTGPSI